MVSRFRYISWFRWRICRFRFVICWFRFVICWLRISCWCY